MVLLLELCYDKPRTNRRASKKQKARLSETQIWVDSSQLCESYVCSFCNQAKGSDVGSIHWESGEFVRFFNPRTDRWADHFVLAGNHIEAVTAIGAVTAQILGFNSGERLLERQTLQEMNRYPSSAALKRMQV